MRKQSGTEVFRITGARQGLADDVRGRQRRYIISMSVRTVSVVLAATLWNVIIHLSPSRAGRSAGAQSAGRRSSARPAAPGSGAGSAGPAAGAAPRAGRIGADTKVEGSEGTFSRPALAMTTAT